MCWSYYKRQDPASWNDMVWLFPLKSRNICDKGSNLCAGQSDCPLPLRFTHANDTYMLWDMCARLFKKLIHLGTTAISKRLQFYVISLYFFTTHICKHKAEWDTTTVMANKAAAAAVANKSVNVTTVPKKETVIMIFKCLTWE